MHARLSLAQPTAVATPRPAKIRSAGEASHMKEFGEALKSIFEKLGQFLDIFDLSFLVSGAATLSAVWYAWNAAGGTLAIAPQGAVAVIALILVVYGCGLLSFAIGRWPRNLGNKPSESFDAEFLRILTAHGLTTAEPFAEYLADDRKATRGTWR